jgi:hypothetical protein
MPSGVSSDRHADITSRKKKVTLSLGSGPAFRLLNPAQHLCFALRTINVARLAVAGLDLTHVLSAFGTLIEQRQHLRIDGVDLLAHHAELLQHPFVHAFS